MGYVGNGALVADEIIFVTICKVLIKYTIQASGLVLIAAEDSASHSHAFDVSSYRLTPYSMISFAYLRKWFA